jgi:hypothetical protein
MYSIVFRGKKKAYTYMYIYIYTYRHLRALYFSHSRFSS